MNFIEKVKATEINPHYAMSVIEWMKLSDAASGGRRGPASELVFDAVTLGFKYGYGRGVKATLAEQRREPTEKPRYRNDVRQAIIYNINHTKNDEALQAVLTMADLLNRICNQKKSRLMTEEEQEKVLVMQEIFKMNVRNLKSIRAVIDGMAGIRY